MAPESSDPRTTRSEPPQTDTPFQFTLKGLLIFVALLSLLCGLCVVVSRPAREAGNRAHCLGLHIGLIALALQDYDSLHGSFPPAYIADENAKPMHSWRVLILPHLGYKDLYSRYDFSEPWDGPNNCLLAKEIPHEYRCPSAHPSNPMSTSYVAVVGDDTVWPGDTKVRMKDISDGCSTTLVVVEVADSDIHWMEPRDLTVPEAIAGVNVDRQHGISSNHPGGACCVLADGFHEFLPDGTSPDVLKALLTKDGGEAVSQSGSGRWIRYP